MDSGTYAGDTESLGPIFWTNTIVLDIVMVLTFTTILAVLSGFYESVWWAKSLTVCTWAMVLQGLMVGR